MTSLCQAVVSEPPHYLHEHKCLRKTVNIIVGVALCGTHYNVAKKWEAQGRLASMMKYWWQIQ